MVSCPSYSLKRRNCTRSSHPAYWGNCVSILERVPVYVGNGRPIPGMIAFAAARLRATPFASEGCQRQKLRLHTTAHEAETGAAGQEVPHARGVGGSDDETLGI